jgi:hypothetical protein
MTIGRREFLAGAGALALRLPSGQAVSARSVFAGAQAARPGAVFPASVRADFPSVALETYMNSAALHPLGTFAARGIEQGLNYRLHGPGPGRVDFARPPTRSPTPPTPQTVKTLSSWAWSCRAAAATS